MHDGAAHVGELVRGASRQDSSGRRCTSNAHDAGRPSRRDALTADQPWGGRMYEDEETVMMRSCPGEILTLGHAGRGCRDAWHPLGSEALHPRYGRPSALSAPRDQEVSEAS